MVNEIYISELNMYIVYIIKHLLGKLHSNNKAVLRSRRYKWRKNIHSNAIQIIKRKTNSSVFYTGTLMAKQPNTGETCSTAFDTVKWRFCVGCWIIPFVGFFGSESSSIFLKLWGCMMDGGSPGGTVGSKFCPGFMGNVYVTQGALQLVFKPF